MISAFWFQYTAANDLSITPTPTDSKMKGTVVPLPADRSLMILGLQNAMTSSGERACQGKKEEGSRLLLQASAMIRIQLHKNTGEVPRPSVLEQILGC